LHRLTNPDTAPQTGSTRGPIAAHGKSSHGSFYRGRVAGAAFEKSVARIEEVAWDF